MACTGSSHSEHLLHTYSVPGTTLDIFCIPYFTSSLQYPYAMNTITPTSQTKTRRLREFLYLGNLLYSYVCFAHHTLKIGVNFHISFFARPGSGLLAESWSESSPSHIAQPLSQVTYPLFPAGPGYVVTRCSRQLAPEPTPESSPMIPHGCLSSGAQMARP